MENSQKPRAISRSREQSSSRGPFQGRELVTWQTMGSTMTMTAPAYIRHSLLFCTQPLLSQGTVATLAVPRSRPTMQTIQTYAVDKPMTSLRTAIEAAFVGMNSVTLEEGVVVEVGWLASASSSLRKSRGSKSSSPATTDIPAPSSTGTFDAVGVPTRALSSIVENSTDWPALPNFMNITEISSRIPNSKSTTDYSPEGTGLNPFFQYQNSSSSMKGMFDSSLGTRVEVNVGVCDTGTGIGTRTLKRLFWSGKPLSEIRATSCGLGLTSMPLIVGTKLGDKLITVCKIARNEIINYARNEISLSRNNFRCIVPHSHFV
ncbi:hypothetical protein ALC53_07170 [Atta colombica]|uniref:Uncharacterized protein n=1 Tax=Atta colombica TaxID=520822 RepID=A0A195BDV1_9HYME|nr:hypothetical protein ALC53_07170 [Atta colombica]